MAALTGTMNADFSDFFFEIDKAKIKLHELESASGETDNALGGMADGLQQVDKTLGLFGVRIGPQIQAMRELGNVSGLTFEKLGAFGSLGLVAAVGAATYKLTEMAVEFTGLDTVIGNATAKLIGWGDVAAANAGAQTDALALATQRAGYAVTTLSEAIRVNLEWNKQNAAAFNTGAQRLADWDRQISKVRQSGDLETITRELKEGSSTVKQLAERFGISAEAITHYTKRAQESSAILEKWRANEQAGIEKVRKAQEELNQAGGGWRETLLTIAPAAAATATAYIAMGQNLTTIATAGKLTEIQVQALDKAYKEQIATLARLEPPTQSLDTWMFTVGKQFQVAAESGDQFKTMLELTGGTIDAIVPKAEKLEETFRSVTEAAREATTETTGKNAPGKVDINLGNIAFGSGGLEAAFKAYSLRYSQSGVGAIGGGPAEDFLSWAMRSGYATQGPQITNNFNVVDTESEIARRVAEEVNRQIQRGSLVS